MPSPFAANVDALARQLGLTPAWVGTPEAAHLATGAEALLFPIGVEGGWLESLLPDPLPPVICAIGLGHDLALDVLLSAAPASRVVLVEPDPADARRLLARRPWAAELDAGRLMILAGPDYAGLSAVARLVPGLRQAPVLVDPRLARRPGEVARARDAIARLIFQADANQDARRALAGRYLLHTLANAPAVAREGDAGRLTGLFTGYPAVIAAAGPSFDRNIHDLFAVRHRALILACDTVAGPLCTAGVLPHLTVAIDASEANARHLATLPSAPGMWLAAEASVHPSALRAFHRRTFFLKVADHEPWPWLGSLGLTRATVDAWGSVATTAFALALAMGCDPIVFIGADFAFTGGRPYCRGTSTESTWASWVAGGKTYEDVWADLIARWPHVEAAGIEGTTRTAPHLVAFRDWIVERAARHPDRRVINGTGAGLLTGPPITQQSVWPALARRPDLDADRIAAALRAAHTAGLVPAALTSLLASATGIATGGDDALVDRWRAFTDGTISREAIRAAVASPEQQAWALGLTAYRALLEAS